MNTDTAAAFNEARFQLQDALNRMNMTQAALAQLLGKSAPTLSQRLKRDSFEIFMEIAEVFPPGARVAARLFSDLSKVYDKQYAEYVRKYNQESRETDEEVGDWLARNKESGDSE